MSSSGRTLQFFGSPRDSPFAFKLVDANATPSAEASFKALALAIRMAVTETGSNDVPSTKGVLAV